MRIIVLRGIMTRVRVAVSAPSARVATATMTRPTTTHVGPTTSARAVSSAPDALQAPACGVVRNVMETRAGTP